MQKNSFIDTHAHLGDPAFDSDRDAVIQRAVQAGVKSIINILCWDKEKGFAGAFDIPLRYPFISLSLGVHPHEADFAGDSGHIDFIREAARERKIVAIGETGLDYHYNHSAKKAQRDIFIKHVKAAREASLPLIVHSREADDDTLSILKDEGAGGIGGVMHCFSGDAKIAEELLELGFYLSFTGVITFPKAEETREVLKIIPIARLMIETDCPYLAPVPYRGKRGEPAFVVEPAKKMAEVKGLREPLIRLDLVKEVGLSLKKRGCRIRIDTDGLANLVHGRNVLPELKFVDCMSVSLKAQDSGTYQKLE